MQGVDWCGFSRQVKDLADNGGSSSQAGLEAVLEQVGEEGTCCRRKGYMRAANEERSAWV